MPAGMECPERSRGPSLQQPRILALVGPTGTGKTDTAVALCQWLGGEIVGADSVQVYRGLDIGSAKPTADALQGIRHHMIDIVDPDQHMDAADFAKRAEQAIAEVISRQAVPVVVGGTGLWIRALLRGLVRVPPVDKDVRHALEQDWQKLGKTVMYGRLAEVDPRAARNIHPNDRVRVLRALEVYEQTGKPLGELREQHALGTPRYAALTINVDIPPVHLAQRLSARTRAMVEAGWADEVRGLLEKYGPSIRSLGSVGYREMVAHVLESASIDITERRIVRATRLYARRQRTWFSHDPDVNDTMTPEQVLGAREKIASHFG